jgi:hypothetical protein
VRHLCARVRVSECRRRWPLVVVRAPSIDSLTTVNPLPQRRPHLSQTQTEHSCPLHAAVVASLPARAQLHAMPFYRRCLLTLWPQVRLQAEPRERERERERGTALWVPAATATPLDSTQTIPREDQKQRFIKVCKFVVLKFQVPLQSRGGVAKQSTCERWCEPFTCSLLLKEAVVSFSLIAFTAWHSMHADG